MLPFNPVRLRFQSEPTDSRILVASLIQRTGSDPRAITQLLQGVEAEQTGEMLTGTCLAIGALRDPGGIAFLERASRHPETAVVRAAVQALGQFDTPEATAALRTASTHPVSEVRSDVLSALSARGDAPAVEIVSTMGRLDPEPELRVSAWQILGSRPGDEFVPYFIDRLGDAPDSARQTVVDILGRLTGRSLGPKRDAWARYWASRESAAATR
jgi:HEAT repeat protein